MAKYIGLDPSFKKTGIAVIDDETSTITFTKVTSEIDKHSTISKFNAITELVNNIDLYLSQYLYTPATYIGQEVSTAYTGWFVAELYALDYALYNHLHYKSTVYNLYSQTFITKVTGHKSSMKDETIKLIEQLILPLFEDSGFKINREFTSKIKIGDKKVTMITDDEADAFIYTLKQYVSYTTNDQLKSEIIKILPELLTGKELL